MQDHISQSFRGQRLNYFSLAQRPKVFRIEFWGLAKGGNLDRKLFKGFMTLNGHPGLLRVDQRLNGVKILLCPPQNENFELLLDG